MGRGTGLAALAAAASALALLSPVATGAGAQPPAPVHLSYGPAGEQELYCWLPPRVTGSLVVLTVHGGGWVGGSPLDGVAALNARLLAEGVPSCSAGYRPATDAPWPAQRRDLSAALALVRDRARGWGVASPAVALIGVSAGGHLVLDAARRGGPGPCAAVAYSPPTSLALLRRDALRGARQAWLARAAGVLAPTAALAASASPGRRPSRRDAPALLFASRDEWVSPAHARRYAAAYRELPRRPDVRVKVLPGRGHALEYLPVPGVWAGTTAFVRAHCGPPAEPWLARGWPAP